MPSSYTSNLGIELPADGELDGVWGDVVNENMSILDRAVNGSISLSLTGTASTLTTSDGILSDGQYKLLILTGAPSGAHTITIAPNDAQKIYFVRNSTAQNVSFSQGSGSNVTIAPGDSGIIYSNGAGAGAAVTNLTNDFAMDSVKITGGDITGITDLAIADGGTGASTAANARTNLGLGTIATQNASSVTITGGDITGITDLAIADGGTGASTAPAARTNLGLGTMATQNAANVAITGGSVAGITDLAIADGGTGASTAADARANLGVAIGSDVQAYSANLDSIAGLATTDSNFVVGNGTTWVAESGATARTSLGLGTMATQNAANVAITGGSITGITDLAIADGGTGASTAADARANLGLGTLATQNGTFSGTSSGTNTGDQNVFLNVAVSGQSTIVADSTTDTLTVAAGTGVTLTTNASTDTLTITNSAPDQVVSLIGGTAIGVTGSYPSFTVNNNGVTSFSAGTTGLTPTLGTAGAVTLAGTLNVANGGTGATTGANARTNLGLGTIATQNANSVAITGGSITGITDLAIADGGTGASTAANARTNLGLGTMATQNANSVAITGGTIAGITDLAVADGGTGASDAATARVNLGLGTIATQSATNVAITGGTLNNVVITSGTITGVGNMGVGTASPAAQLHVSGSTTDTANVTASISGTTMTVTAVTAGTISVGDIVYGAAVSPITKVVAFGTGSGGVGTYTVSVSQTAASGVVRASSGTASTIRIEDTDGTVFASQPQGTIEFYGNDVSPPGAGVGAYIGAVAENASPDTALVFGTRDNNGGGSDANERMRITSLGRVGIGTSSPSTELDVNGTANVTALAISGTAVTATAAELNFSSGVTSALQTQLDGKQPLASNLTAVAGIAANGLLARTGAATAASRSIVGTAPVTVTNGNGVSGNPTVAVTLATQAQAEAGTDNTTLMTPLRTKQAMLPAYESAEQTITLGGSLTLSHGLGRLPHNMDVWLVCKTADLGWSVDDWYGPIGAETFADGANNGVAIAMNTTQVKITSGSFNIAILNRSTGVRGAITLTSWRYVVRAW